MPGLWAELTLQTCKHTRSSFCGNFAAGCILHHPCYHTSFRIQLNHGLRDFILADVAELIYSSLPIQWKGNKPSSHQSSIVNLSLKRIIQTVRKFQLHTFDIAHMPLKLANYSVIFNIRLHESYLWSVLRLTMNFDQPIVPSKS